MYLGAPVATPLDPRHRLVTTKYNPARTWTPENAVGIGGAYLCVYGMEGPGGYQFVGRTVPVWYLDVPTPGDEPDVPWLLRPFDQIRFHPVGAEELLDLRGRAKAGELELDIEPTTFRLAEHLAFLDGGGRGHRRVPGRAAGRVRRRARPLEGLAESCDGRRTPEPRRRGRPRSRPPAPGADGDPHEGIVGRGQRPVRRPTASTP